MMTKLLILQLAIFSSSLVSTAQDKEVEITAKFIIEICQPSSAIHCLGCHDINDSRFNSFFIFKKNNHLIHPSIFFKDTLFILPLTLIGKGGMKEQIMHTEKIHEKINKMIDNSNSENTISFKTPFWFKKRMNKALKECNATSKYDGYLRFAIFNIQLKYKTITLHKELSVPNTTNIFQKIYFRKMFVIHEITDIINIELP